MRGYTELLRYIKVTISENYLGTQSESVSKSLLNNTIKIEKNYEAVFLEGQTIPNIKTLAARTPWA